MVEVLVEYDYTAKEPDELTIKKGDVIKEVVRKPGGWWEGVLHDRKGMFPDNFVKLLDKDPAVTLRSRKDASRIRQCRVVFSYRQDHPDELSLNVGDVIDILGEEEEGWWRGLLNGREGVFPSNFVEEIKSKPGSREDLTNVNENDLKSPLLPPKPAKTVCQVKFSYKAQNEDELSLKEGDVITLISRDGQDVGWWRGELNGRVGVFPDNFVVVLSDPDDKAPKEDRRKSSEPPKTATSAQRKSLEERRHAEERKPEEKPEKETDSVRVTPPVPSKKPTIPIKKSPSGSAAQVGLLAGLRKKLVDVVDGATNSKSSQPVLVKASEIKDEGKEEALPANAFDQVERTPMLSDVRATRAKAPDIPTMSDLGKILEAELKCAVCKSIMAGSIKLCESGHNICESCTNKLATCPLCLKSITAARNLALESLAAKTTFPCVNHSYGCKEKLNLKERQPHEGKCAFKPVKCLSCDSWNGTRELKQHWRSKGLQVQNVTDYVAYTVDLTSMLKNKSAPCTLQFYLVEAYDQLFWLKLKIRNKRISWVLQLIGSSKNNKKYAYGIRLAKPTKPLPCLTYSNYCQETNVKPNSFNRGFVTELSNEILQPLLDDKKCLHFKIIILPS